MRVSWAFECSSNYGFRGDRTPEKRKVGGSTPPLTTRTSFDLRKRRFRAWSLAPVGADNVVTSSDLRILVDQTAQPIASSDAYVVAGGCAVGSAVGWSLAEGPVRPVRVVVIDVVAEGAGEMSLAGDEGSVSALAPGAGDPPFADRVRARCLDRRGDDPHAGRSEDGVERVGVLGIPVPDQELQAAGPVAEVHEPIPGLLHRPSGGRVGGDAGQVHAAVMVLDDEQHIEPAEEDGVDVEEIDRGDCPGLGRQELFPAGRRALRCGVDAGCLEDLPDGGGRDLVAEAGQLAKDPPVAPGRVVAGHLQCEPTDRRASARPSRGPAPIGPVPLY